MDTTKICAVVNCRLVPAPTAPLGPITSLLKVPFATPGRGTPPPVNRNLNPRVIHNQAVAKLKVALRHVHTEEDLKYVEERIDAITYVFTQHDFPVECI
jgi:hypothetical protein